MDFERIKQNVRYRSGRSSRNMSKRFPTRARDAVPIEPPAPKPQEQKVSPTTRQNPPPATKSKPTHRHNPSPVIIGDSKTAPREQGTKQVTSPAIPRAHLSSSDSENYEFPPSAVTKSVSLEDLSEELYSEGYLHTLTNDPQLLARFSAFLNKYGPDIAPLVARYLEIQKVIKAVRYANAVAFSIEQLGQPNQSSEIEKCSPVAELSAEFHQSSQDVFKTLLSIALPAWVTYSLVKTSTFCLTSEITNRSTALTRDLVGGLSEVFCLTNPEQADNPIVYASQEFYRLTGYHKDNVIGYNCRFLQGPGTKRESVERLKSAIKNGEEISEALLNYRRDGKPFMNVLMLAPLHDDKGKVKYYLGAQVDASRLIEHGRGVEGFERYLMKKEMDSQRQKHAQTDLKQAALDRLRDLSISFDLEESAVVKNSSRSSSRTRVESGEDPTARRRLDDTDSGSDSEDDHLGIDGGDAWKLSRDRFSGNLPGIYKKYILLRPYPSLRTIFISQAARQLGQLQQRPFLASVAAPPSTLTGLKDAFESNTPVTARVAILSRPGDNRDGMVTGKWGKKGESPAEKGKTCWISATPMMDSNNKVGVWMLVIVDKAAVTANTGRAAESLLSKEDQRFESAGRIETSIASNLPIKPKPIGDLDELDTAINSISLEPIEESQRSGRVEDESRAIANGRPESPNGSTVFDNPYPTQLVNGETDGKLTPERQDFDLPLDVTPTRNSAARSGRDIGLRAMDYLTSRSPMNNRQTDSVDEESEEIIASPYSID